MHEYDPKDLDFKNERGRETVKIHSEEQILDLVEQELSPPEFETFLRVFFLYSKNIISYCEFVDLCE